MMDDQSFDTLFNIITIMAFGALLGTLIRAAMNQKPPTKKCLHKWSIDNRTTKLTCCDCGFVAGSASEPGEL